jgi:PleD family two-component response regulator
VILVSEKPDARKWTECIEKGVNDFIIYPVDSDVYGYSEGKGPPEVQEAL